MKKNILIVVVIFSLSLFFIGSLKAKAEEIKTNLVFPITELGNCNSQAECKIFCDKQDNILTCVNFAEKNGMMTKEEIKNAREFADILKGDGPGGCQDKQACENYCSEITNLDQCLTFAEKHNFVKKEDLKQAKKVSQALKLGAKLPGNCKDKQSCENYCSLSNNSSECLVFAEKAGFVSIEEAEMARKVLPLIEKGESPGKCKNKGECEKYCASSDNLNECLNFAEKAGFVSKEDSEMARKIGGKGPGGCKDKKSCDEYCNKIENQNTCFDFAVKYNILPEEKVKEIQEGMGRLRSGIKQAPEEVVACLKENIGPNIIEDIENGTLVPGPAIGDRVKSCFDKNMGKIKEKVSKALDKASVETMTCLKEKLGEDTLAKVKAGEALTPEMGDIFKACFEMMKEEGLDKLRINMKDIPEEAKQCLIEKLGADKMAAIERGEDVELGEDTGELISECLGKMEVYFKTMMDQAMSQMPEEIRNCVKEKLGADFFAQAQQQGSMIQEKVKSIATECLKGYKPAGIPEGLDLNNLPSGIPSSGIPSGIPSSGTGVNIPTSTAPDFSPGSQACQMFMMAPSCDYVPENVREICKKCKG